MRTPKTPKDWGFDGRDCRRLQQALKRISELRLYRRVLAVLVVARGGTCRDAAELAGVTERVVSLWIGRYLRHHQVSGLIDATRSGRPSVAQSLTDALLAREFAKDPQSLGYRATTWTVPLLARHLTRVCGCLVTQRTLRRRMHALDLAWKRPRHVYSEKAEHLPQKKGALFAA
jgi:transposase